MAGGVFGGEGGEVCWGFRRTPCCTGWRVPAGRRISRTKVQGDTPARGNAAADDPKAMANEIRELQARIKRLEMEKEILKKATAYFATLQP